MSGVFTMLIVAALSTILGDGRSLLKASEKVDQRIILGTAVGDNRYGIGMIKDSNGRLWTNDHHLSQIWGCDEHIQMAQAACGLSIATLVFAVGTLICNLRGSQTGKGLYGTLAAGLSAGMCVFLLISFILTGAVYTVSYSCKEADIVCPPKETLATCDSFSCSAGFKPKPGVTELTCPLALHGGCSDEVCCHPVVKKCADWQCPSGFTKKAVSATVCVAAEGCNDETCCDQTCATVTCQTHYKNKGSTQSCGVTNNCAHAFCCEKTCSAHTCTVSTHFLRGDKASIVCPIAGGVSTCDDATCCSTKSCQTPPIFTDCRADAKPYPLGIPSDQSKYGCPPTAVCNTDTCCTRIPTCLSASFECPHLYTAKANQGGLRCTQDAIGNGKCDTATCCNAPASVNCDTFICPTGFLAKPYSHKLRCGIKKTDCDVSTCCAVIQPTTCVQPLSKRRSFEDTFDLGYALPTLVVSFVFALANIIGLVLLGSMKDEVAPEEDEQELKGHAAGSPNEPIDEHLDGSQ